MCGVKNFEAYALCLDTGMRVMFILHMLIMYIYNYKPKSKFD